MNVAVTIFYSIAGAYLLGMFIYFIVKKTKQKKKINETKKEVENVEREGE